jgi:hypothetical protein
MLLTALYVELASRDTKFTKTTLVQQTNARNCILRTIQDDDIEFDRLKVRALKAFSLTLVKQTAPRKLQYKQPFLS